jgi:hypothetical protein
MAAALDAAGTGEIPGTVLFLGSDDRFYTVTVEASIGECNPTFVREWVGEYVAELEGELEDCDPGTSKGRSRVRAIRRQIADLNQRLERLPREEENTVDNTIPAECHSDDRVFEVAFDPLAWFEQADPEDIVELARCGWGGDYPADAVARFMAEQNGEVQALFDSLDRLGDLPSHKDLRGFECHVEEEAALAWLRANRPEVYEDVRRELNQGDSDDAE